MTSRVLISGLALAALAAGSAHAQGTLFGHAPGSVPGLRPSSATPPPRPSYGATPSPHAYTPHASISPAAPATPGFKPYEPDKGASVYGAPKPPSYGAKPCETSVYVNACDKSR